MYCEQYTLNATLYNILDLLIEVDEKQQEF